MTTDGQLDRQFLLAHFDGKMQPVSLDFIDQIHDAVQARVVPQNLQVLDELLSSYRVVVDNLLLMHLEYFDAELSVRNLGLEPVWIVRRGFSKAFSKIKS